MLEEIKQLQTERAEKNRVVRLATLFDPNLYLMFIFAAVLVLMMLNGCADQSEEPKDAKNVQFDAQVVAEPTPNKYHVELKWKNSGGRPLGWFIRREEVDSGKDYMTAFELEKTSLTDDRVLPGKTYRYEFGSAEAIGNVKRAEATVTIPSDLQVSGTAVRPAITGINRLFLNEGARIVTMGEKFALNVSEIYSQNGVIESFPENQSAPDQSAGRPGGTIEVHAKLGRGALYIYGRGENGGSGIAGRIGAAGKKGAEGRLGLATHETVDVVCNCGARARELEEQVRQGNPFGLMQYMMEKARHRCISQTGDGASGEQGGTGGNGGNGGQGGDSSRVIVEVADAVGFDVRPYASAGTGGRGGTPGEGGAGGPGGDPGNTSLDYYHVCREAHAGSAGPKGQKGNPGSNGVGGKQFPVCLRLGSIQIGDCGSH